MAQVPTAESIRNLRDLLITAINGYVANNPDCGIGVITIHKDFQEDIVLDFDDILYGIMIYSNGHEA